ncbi:MAG: cupredoxin domain-containing protein [Candidatus Nanoarchaeia archaeon]
MENETVKVIGGVIIILLAFFFVRSLLVTNDSYDPQMLPAAGVEIKDGVQEVVLSWGKLNYAPQEIVVKKDIPVRITADLKRLKGCFRSFTIPAFRFTKVFTEGDNVIEFTPDKVGTFPFSCTMGMGRGKIVVVE